MSIQRIFLSLVVACPMFAGEYAVLHNGFRIRAERHEVIADKIRLYTGEGSTDVPSANVSRFETDEYIAPAPAPQKLETTTAVKPETPSPKELVDSAAIKHGLRPEFVRSVAAAESAFQPLAVSPKGAIGLMQLMPGTAADLGVNPHDPAQNAEAGARYLRELLLRYQNSSDPVRLALAAYNAGPGAVDRYKDIPPYRETQQYVERVLRRYLAEMKQ